ncbi:hypothetical protein GPA25_16830 [Aromatoleum diolicum]|uniref:DUF1145 domain-containing protein n=2 Tax=Aromatoleum diolicum TaxID=75796 RepID=A0ABX1QG89_9RHOO|nr:hypothetical protein [Aromatoleum diolicum]
MNTLLKGACLVIYAVAAVGLIVELPFQTGTTVAYAALLLLGAHVLEVLFAFKSIKLYKGSIIVSVFLTVLFGFLHWIPLAKEDARGFK